RLHRSRRRPLRAQRRRYLRSVLRRLRTALRHERSRNLRLLPTRRQLPGRGDPPLQLTSAPQVRDLLLHGGELLLDGVGLLLEVRELGLAGFGEERARFVDQARQALIGFLQGADRALAGRALDQRLDLPRALSDRAEALGQRVVSLLALIEELGALSARARRLVLAATQILHLLREHGQARQKLAVRLLRLHEQLARLHQLVGAAERLLEHAAGELLELVERALQSRGRAHDRRLLLTFRLRHAVE